MIDPAVVKESLTREYNSLGSLSFHESAITFLFFSLIMLWFFRDPGFIPGWTSLFANR